MKKLLLSAAMVGAMLAIAGSAQAADKKTLVFVVNGASDFWKAAEAGVKKAQAELPNYKLDFKYPEQSSAAIQTRLMDDLVAAGVSGIMVSAVDPKTMGDALDRIGKQVALFTTDSDAPKSSRVAYIGSSNVDAGKQAGEIALKALPNGGKCMGFVGLPGADNARERIEGFKRHDQGLEDRTRRRSRRRHRPDPFEAQRRGHADRASRDQLHGRLLFLQHAGHLSGAEAGRQARPDHGHRLRRRSDHARRRQGRHDRVDRRPAALRVGLSGHEGHGEVSRRRQVVRSRRTASSSSRPRSSARTTSTPSGPS